MKKMLQSAKGQKLSKTAQQSIKGGILAGYKYICFGGYECSNVLSTCNTRCQRLYGMNCAVWNAPCP